MASIKILNCDRKHIWDYNFYNSSIAECALKIGYKTSSLHTKIKLTEVKEVKKRLIEPEYGSVLQ